LILLILVLDGGEWLGLRSGRFTPGKRAHGIHWTRTWAGPRGWKRSFVGLTSWPKEEEKEEEDKIRYN